MSALTTGAEYKRGRWVYIFGFFLLYLVLINFPDIARMILLNPAENNVDGGAEVPVGSWLSDESGEGPTSNDDPTMPIFVAIAMVVGVASPTFKFIEGAIRAVAYAISGVPRNIYRVIANLEELSYEKYTTDVELPLKASFTSYLETKAAEGLSFSDNTTTHITSSLQIIDLLQGPIIGPQRNIFFSLFSGETPLERIDGLRARYNQLRDKIAKLKESDDPVESLDEVLAESTELAGSMQCLFALFAIRSRKNSDGAPSTVQSQIIREITTTGRAQSINDIMLGACFGVIFGGVLMFLYADFLIGDAEQKNADATHRAVRGLMGPLLPSVVIFSVFTIFLRHVKVDQSDWQTNEVNNINFSGYARLVIWPTIFSVLFYTVIMTTNSEKVWLHLSAGEFSEARGMGLDFVAAEIRQLPRLCAIFFFFGCGLLFVADQHENLSWQITVGAIGSVLSVILMVVAILFGYMIPVPDGGILTSFSTSLMLLLPFVVTIFFYASAAEFAETDSSRKLLLRFALKDRGK